ncbi:MATE family efflux transporter [Pseudohongiella spirulinae]|uniref:MATE family efflux transporter n=1 Tax=Pseudohongiella spirulinae TaxID=1249552 RepID=UPI000A4AA74E|nr:MATE family efflux transporter [Pseudohongiella spirulinae]
MLANASVPLLGLSDTAVIGNYGSLEALGAIAFGSIVFSFVYWSFGFLRMGTTGFVAQAVGARDEAEIRAAVWRAVFIGAIIGFLLILIQSPISTLSLLLLQGSDTVEAMTHSYIQTRIWGAPAALILFALMGCLIGLGKSKSLLAVQLFMNGLNIVLDILFAGVLEMGATGIALGTAIAEWSSLLLALFIVVRSLRERATDTTLPLIPWSLLHDATGLLHTLSVNRDIMIRTLLMVASFAWFVRQSATYGDEVLAANHILLQLISFSAFFLDAYAYVAEALVGEAMGAGDDHLFDQALWRSSCLAGGSALVLASIIYWGGELIVPLLSQHPAVWLAATDSMHLAALYVALAFAAFQLDGVFIGTTQTAQMRNASILSVLVFVPLSVVLGEQHGVIGLWWAFVMYVVTRAITLGYYLPGLRFKVQSRQTRQAGSAT